MYIKYKTQKIEKMCNNLKEATKKIGAERATILMRRITQLEAFECLHHIPCTKPFRRHKLEGNYKDFFAVNIDDQYRIIFKPEFEDNIVDIKEINLKNITIITIEEVSKHYDD